jgi:hypothetical protein
MKRGFQIGFLLLLAAFVIVLVSILVRHPDVVFPESGSTVNVKCLSVPRGPRLHFINGEIFRNGVRVASYQLEPAVPGKYGPRVLVNGVRITDSGDGLSISHGTEHWYWPIRPTGQVELFYYPQNMVVAIPC